jgi:RND superfamily putative drug exporter
MGARAWSWPERPARWLVRGRLWIALAWAVAAILLVPQAGRIASVLDASARIDGSESAAVERLLAGPLASSYARVGVLVVGGIPSPATPAGAEALGRIAWALREAPQVAGVFSYLDRPDTLFLGTRGQGTFVLVGFPVEAGKPDEFIPPLRQLTQGLADSLRARHPAATLRWTGESALNVDLRKTSSRDVGAAERRVLPLTTLFLLVAFGAVLAALLPVVAGALAIVVTLGAAALLAGAWPLSILLQSLVVMLGLGLGIDYALLMVSRFREGLAAGAPPERAAEEAARHAGHTILLSAMAVALGFAALLTVPLNELRAIAVGGLLVVVVSALLATTLLPGVLAWLGPRVDWGRVRPRARRGAMGEGWSRWGRWVTARPWRALVLGALPLVLLASQAPRLRTGLPRGNWLPPTMESSRGIEDLHAMGRRGVVQTLRVVVELPPRARAMAWEGLARFDQALARDPRIARVRSLFTAAEASGLEWRDIVTLPVELAHPVGRGLMSEDGRWALLELVPRDDVTPAQAVALARELRARAASRIGVPGMRVRVGGLPAFNADYQDAVAGRFRQIVTLIVGGTLLALLVGFRSVLVPLKAVSLNLLTVGATFGALVLVFQEGHGARLFGVSEPLGAVFSSLPVIVFAIVFGLSMDYEVFLMNRVREAWRAGATNRDAIVMGLGTTAQVITSAAGIMLVVFAAFTLGDLLLTKMLGFALAVAVLLDATIVRMVIGPALLQLAGRWNWWPGGGRAGE